MAMPRCTQGSRRARRCSAWCNEGRVARTTRIGR
ncbi:hypothetical protein Ae406Ps2_6464 [Pseudonocardia sp. Ae406_Ps2]|nr:hypothetical protein Ae406Ps2_6464 [Pseudonocardia sp. Ae406_Ps2]